MRVLARSALLFILTCAGVSQTSADENVCKIMREATYARMRLPHSILIDTTQPGRKPIHGQEVYLKTVHYQLLLGHWVKTATSPEREIDGERKLNATLSDCRREGHATFRGEGVSIYSAKTRNFTLVPFSGDLRMWISDKSAVPLRTEANASIPFLGQSHTVKVYSYENIRAPAGS